MKKLMICLLFSSLLLTSCGLQKEDNNYKANSNAGKQVTENTQNQGDKTTGNKQSQANNGPANNTNENTNNDISSKAVTSKVQLYEGNYFDSKHFGGENSINPWIEIEVSNITDTSFDFTIYQVEYTDKSDSASKERKVIFLTNKAIFTGDGTEATFLGHDYTLKFTFPNNHNALPVVTDMEVTGFGPIEGKTFVNNGIPGHEFG